MNIENLNIDIIQIKDYWLKSSDKDFLTMNNLYDTKDYNWSLFLGHLVIEKLLKCLYIHKLKQLPPFTHNLLRLAEMCEINLNIEINEILATLTTFNINSRYDDYRDSFYYKCTKEFTEIWLKKIKEFREWIKTMLTE